MFCPILGGWWSSPPSHLCPDIKIVWRVWHWTWNSSVILHCPRYYHRTSQRDHILPDRSLISCSLPDAAWHPPALSWSRMRDIRLVSADSPRERNSGTDGDKTWGWHGEEISKTTLFSLTQMDSRLSRSSERLRERGAMWRGPRRSTDKLLRLNKEHTIS